MKKSTLLLLLIFISPFAFSQIDKEYSEPFKQHVGWTKVIQISNGNTGLIEVTKKEGIKFSLYGADRTLLVKPKSLPFKNITGKLSGASYIPAIYAINNDVVLFVMYYADIDNKLIPSLYRVIVDGTTGALKEEKAIGDVPPIIVKDPDSDYYAIMVKNPEHNDPSRVAVYHYNPSHELINTFNATCDMKSEMRAIAMVVKKDEYIITCTGVSGNNTTKLQLHKFTKANPKGQQQFLQFGNTSLSDLPKGKFIVNPVKNSITVAIVVFKNAENGTSFYNVAYQTFDISTLNLQPYQEGSMNKLNDYYHTIAQRKDDFSGLPEASSVDKDGNIIMLYQGKTAWTRDNITTYYVGDIGLTINTFDGKTISAQTLSWACNRYGEMDVAFNYDDVKTGSKRPFGYEGGGTNGWSWLYDLDIVSTNEATYLFANTTKFNYEKAEADKVETMRDIENANGVLYTISAEGASKKYLFGTPENKNDGKYGNFNASDYKPKTKMYCTIVGDRKEKTQQIIWLKLE